MSSRTRYEIDDNFDVAFVDALAQREVFNKHHFRPNSYRHKWWARRCGTTFRAILKAVVEDDRKRDFYAAGGLEGKLILDPMAGGGTTLHEAIRMGANVIGADIDPLPILQARATLSEVDLDELIAAYRQLEHTLKRSSGEMFCTHCPACRAETPLRFTLYGQKRSCGCAEPAIIVDTLTLRHNSDGSRWHLVDGNVYRDGRCVYATASGSLRLVERRNKSCATCSQPFVESAERYFERYVPLVIFGKCDQCGLFFKPLDQVDQARIDRADKLRDKLFLANEFVISTGPKSAHLHARGIINYLDLFSSRQLLLLRAAIDALQVVPENMRLNLALLISGATEFNSMLCGYKGWHKQRPGAIRHTFVRHAYSIPYTALENNPLYGTNRSGTLHKLFQSRFVQAIEWANRPIERSIHLDPPQQTPIENERDFGSEVFSFTELSEGFQRFLLMQGDSAHLNLPTSSVDFIVTDPPYFDSVQYSDLSEFFHVWLKKMLPSDAANWETITNSAVNGHNKSTDYLAKLGAIFLECGRVLKQNGRFIFTFHHWKAQAWAELTIALRRANFQLIRAYVVQSESPTSIHIQNQNALQHDLLLVLGTHTTGEEQLLLSTIDKSDSRTFIAQCGEMVGYFLAEHSSTENEIAAYWERLLT